MLSQKLHGKLLEQEIEHFAADETSRAAQVNSSIFHQIYTMMTIQTYDSE